MNRISLIITGCLLVLLASCEGGRGNESEVVGDTVVHEATVEPKVPSVDGCYRMIQNKDTGFLNVSIDDGNVSGKLRYNRYEKDSNNGVINGILRDSLIIADYSFQSEGMNSVREVVFLVKGDSIFEGYGEIKVTGDTSRFVDRGQLKFMNEPFVKVGCDQK